MKKRLMVFFILLFSAITHVCCSSAQKKVQKPTTVATIHPLDDFETFKATKALLALMQRNLADNKNGRKTGIHVEFGDHATAQGIAAYYYATPFMPTDEIPKQLYTPWGRFSQDQYKKDTVDKRELILKQTPLPEWKKCAGGDYYAVTQVNSIQLPTPKKLQNSSKENYKIMYQNAWAQLEARFDEKKDETYG